MNPHEIDDAQIKQELDRELGGVTAADLGRMAAAAPPVRHAEERGRIRGRILSIRGADVFVDIGGKSEGFLSLDEFPPDKPPQIGDSFDLVPHGFDKDSGLMRLSLSEIRTDSDTSALKVGDMVKARVTGMNVGGLELRVGGARGFMPLSQVDLVRHDDFASFIGRWLEAEVTEIDRKGRNMVLSRRRLLERAREGERQQLRAELAEGQVRKGVVRRLAEFGAFVDIGGGIEGLLHVSDMSWARVNRPGDVLKPGDEFDVKILKLDLEKNRISLGRKQLAPDPWTLVATNYQVGQTVEGRVTRIMDFGAFVEVESGIEGLIPVSEMSWTQRVAHPKQILNPGDMVRASVLLVDPEKRKLTLSLKALGQDPWVGIADRYQADATVAGTVTRITNFGAFVLIEDGVEGLVHISELSDKHVKTVGEVVQPGKVVQARVLGVDGEQRRISLSLRTPAAQVAAEAAAALPIGEPPKPKKERKKPLRGGLSY